MDTHASPLDFLGKPEYNQFITCPRTRTRVSFAEIGATNRPTLLFIVPSFCSRFIGAPQLTPLAEHYGVRVISVDRPGCGGTTQCPLNKRLAIASDNVRSVLEYLGVDPKDTFIATHSAGAMFTLHLLGKHPDLFPKNPHVFMTSAWVPVSVSGQMGLNLVPSMLISNFHKFLPTFVPIFNGVGSSLAFSKGLLTGRSMDESAFTPPDVMRPISSAPTTFHRNHIFQIPKAWNDAILHCITNLESTQGVSQDYLLCLGRNEGGIDSKWHEQMVTNISHAYKERGARVHFELWWAANDKIIPVKGQKWFTELLKKQGDAFEVTSFDLVGVGHDDPLMFAEVFCPIFEEVRASCSQ